MTVFLDLKSGGTRHPVPPGGYAIVSIQPWQRFAFLSAFRLMSE